MIIDIDKALEHSFVLTHLPWQYGLFCKRMQAAGFKTMPTEFLRRMPHCLMLDGVVGGHKHYQYKAVSTTYYHIINMANTLGWDYVTVFESDAYPMTDCRNELNQFFTQNPAPDDTVCLSLGNLHWVKHDGSHSRGVVGRYVLPDCLCGAHAVLHPKSGYRRWLDGYLSKPENADCNSDHLHSIHPQCYTTDWSYFIQVYDSPQGWIKDTGIPYFKHFAGLDPETGAALDYNDALAGYGSGVGTSK